MGEFASMVGGLCLGYVLGFVSCGLFVTWIASPYDEPNPEDDDEDEDDLPSRWSDMY